MYKIYCNDHQLVLASHPPESADDWTLVTRYHGKPKSMFPILDAMEKRSGQEQVWLYHEDMSVLWHDFKHLFTLVEAAGGIVLNPLGEILVIYRRGYLDLPKGKLETGESFPEAAEREVKEETGLRDLKCGGPAGETWHLFKEKKRRFLKYTAWFWMEADQAELIPQAEEGIEDVRWIRPETYANSGNSTFRNIRDMMNVAFEL
ncbi:MAG: NUDIX hydrolase [Saprospiraceae bacterium]|nr:NUDIX hydrolase [Saprospiraceae bacterium]